MSPENNALIAKHGFMVTTKAAVCSDPHGVHADVLGLVASDSGTAASDLHILDQRHSTDVSRRNVAGVLGGASGRRKGRGTRARRFAPAKLHLHVEPRFQPGSASVH